MRSLRFVLLFFLSIATALAQTPIKVILDADTANEVDDLYALVRALIEPSWEVVGLNATQWQASQWATERTMEDSYRLNSVLLSSLRRSSEVPSHRGAEGRLYDWGTKHRPSAASNAIIREAHKLPDNQKLQVVAMGALTNVASAIMDDPTIIPKLSVHWLGTAYDFEQQTMSTIDFNAVMDIQATDIVLRSAVDLHIMPVSVARNLDMDYDALVSHFGGGHPLLEFLVQRWFHHHDGSRERRIIWDLALVSAMIQPAWAEKVRVRTSKERGDREIWLYRTIDAEAMRQDFFRTARQFIDGLK